MFFYEIQGFNMTASERWREAGWQAGSVSQGDLMCLAPGMPIRFPSEQIPARSLHSSLRTQPPEAPAYVCLCEKGGNCMPVCETE